MFSSHMFRQICEWWHDNCVWQILHFLIFNTGGISRDLLSSTSAELFFSQLSLAELCSPPTSLAELHVRLLNIAVIIKPDLDDRSHQSRFHRSDLQKWSQNWNLLICRFLDWVSFYQILCSIQYFEKSQNRLGILSWNESSFQFLYCVRVLQIFAAHSQKHIKLFLAASFTFTIQFW